MVKPIQKMATILKGSGISFHLSKPWNIPEFSWFTFLSWWGRHRSGRFIPGGEATEKWHFLNATQLTDVFEKDMVESIWMDK
eukprot:Pgem_evm1s10660